MDVHKPARMLLFFAGAAAALACGFRTFLILLGLTLVVLFFLEGFHRTRALPVCAGLGILAAVAVLPFAYRLPMSVQRTLSFLPARLDVAVENEVNGSTQWRVDMWKVVWPDVPKYLWKGKGYVLDPNEMFMESVNGLNGFAEAAVGSRIAGDYHNGPLSVLIPFGIFGLAAFLWFLGAAIHTMYRYCRLGDPALRSANAFLLAAFIAKCVVFFFVFGSLYSELFVFMGLIGMAVSLNGRLPVRSEVYEQEKASEEFVEELAVRDAR
jgi:hypothetical protein